MSETCRVIINQVKQKLHLVGYLLTRYFKDARYHERKKKYVPFFRISRPTLQPNDHSNSRAPENISFKQTGCELGHKSAHGPVEELVEQFLHYSCLRVVHWLLTLTVSSQSSGEIKGRQAGLNIKGTYRAKSN